MLVIFVQNSITGVTETWDSASKYVSKLVLQQTVRQNRVSRELVKSPFHIQLCPSKIQALLQDWAAWNCVGSLGRVWAAGQLAGWRSLWVDACPRQAGRHKGTFLCFRTCLLDHLSFFLSFRLLSSTLLLLTTVARWSISFFIGIFFSLRGYL